MLKIFSIYWTYKLGKTKNRAIIKPKTSIFKKHKINITFIINIRRKMNIFLQNMPTKSKIKITF